MRGDVRKAARYYWPLQDKSIWRKYEVFNEPFQFSCALQPSANEVNISSRTKAMNRLHTVGLFLVVTDASRWIGSLVPTSVPSNVWWDYPWDLSWMSRDVKLTSHFLLHKSGIYGIFVSQMKCHFLPLRPAHRPIKHPVSTILRCVLQKPISISRRVKWRWQVWIYLGWVCYCLLRRESIHGSFQVYKSLCLTSYPVNAVSFTRLEKRLRPGSDR